MKDEEANHPQDELARLRQENARLRAMIDQLERRGGDEPAPLVAETQIIRTEPEVPAPARRARSVERPKRVRRPPRPEPDIQCLIFVLTTSVIGTAWIVLLLFAFHFSGGHANGWLWLALSLLCAPVILGSIAAARGLHQKKAQAKRRHTPSKPHQPTEKRPRRRRITRKLRAATTQKLDEEHC
jgi:hypothetical protein